MSHWEHGRTRIFNQGQHPFRHSPSELPFSHEGLPGVTNVQDALNYLFNVLYPNYIGTFDTVADLPLAPAANSYAIVSDDGDGKAAGYIFQAIDNTAQWVKRYDVDWSMEDILAETVIKTQALYVSKYGSDDKDASGTTLTGQSAGQHIYGGATSGTNLTLHANSGDTGGARTGAIYVDDSVLPTADSALSLGSLTRKYLELHAASIYTSDIDADTIITSSSITAGGAITGSNLSGTNTGDVTIGAFQAAGNAAGLSLSGQSLRLHPATDTHPGAVSTAAQTFAGDKTFSGGIVVQGASGVAVTAGITAGGAIAASGTVTGSNLSGTNTGDMSVAAAVGGAPNDAGASISSQVLTLQPADGTHPGVVTASTQTIGGAKTLTGALTLSAAGTALTIDNDATISGDLTIGSAIKSGSTEFLVAELVKLRNVLFRDAARTSAVQNGDSLIYDSTSGTWLAAPPASSISHTVLDDLATGDSGHTQFTMLAGRAGGQTVQGGTAASENLTLESTAHASKGAILVKDPVRPATTAAHSGTWAGTDLGGSTNYFRDLYMKGEAKGLRAENYTSTTLPTANASDEGRLVWATDDKQLYGVSGSAWVKIGVRRFMSDTSWNGTDTTKTVTVSSTITDARMAIWALHDNASNHERMYAKIQAISATQVTITFELAPPAGSYRLIGLE